MVKALCYSVKLDISVDDWPGGIVLVEKYISPDDDIDQCLGTFRTLRDEAQDDSQKSGYGKCAIVLSYAQELGGKLGSLTISPSSLSFVLEFAKLKCLQEYCNGLENFNDSLIL
ncbi:MAG: hypothetical protein U0L97_02390 [Candidatus Saccharimonadaceae bacterium]|nr:hypothetical protein [Candidatus Saccharimonadaceae bacterium]